MVAGLLEGLNAQQRAAVTAGEGPVLVLAGPGSGKTRVLTHRIAYLIGEMGIYPDSIMAVTFTNKAAGEMRTRVQNLLAGSLHGLQIGTFHAICARLLRREWQKTPYGADYVIFDTDDQVTAVTQALNELNVDLKKWPPRRVLNAISTAKNELIEPGRYVAVDYFGEIVARVYQRYQAVLLDNNAMDFDDLLMQMVLLLRENPEVCAKYQRLYPFILVDEFQDTNTAQYELVQIMGKPQDNVFVVGDEDQGIYAFRGADFRNVLRFRQDYPSAQVILLEQNYRSTQVVLDVARAIIDKNTQRTPKALFTEREGGALVNVNEAYNEKYEAEFIAGEIDRLRRDRYDFRDFAIMYRTNAQSRAIEETCIREGIPYRLVGGVGFYKRREIRDLLAYLRVINNPSDKVSFARIINVPKRGIGQKSLQEFQAWAAQEDLDYAEALTRLVIGAESPLSGRTRNLFMDFGQMLAGWRRLAEAGELLELFDDIVARIGYTLYLHEISDTEEQAIDRAENVRELRGLVAQAQESTISLADFLAEQSLVADVDELKDNENSVTLLTLHSAKGLEYPVVFITGLEEGLMPHVRAFDDPDGMGEERRLMYVGITRARDLLYLSYAFRRTVFGSSMANTPSRFLADIPGSLTEGMSPIVAQQASRQSFLRETTWDPNPRSEQRYESRLNRDLRRFGPPGGGSAEGKRAGNERLRSKIIPFKREQSPAAYRTGQRVLHPKYGSGTVIECKPSGDDEEITVAFEDKKVGIKRLLASFANLRLVDG